LKARRGGDCGRTRTTALEQAVEQRLHAVERGRRAVRDGHARDAEDLRDAVARRLGCSVALEVHQDPARELLDGGGAGVGERALDVAPQVTQEQRAVAALRLISWLVDDEDGPQPHHLNLPAPPARAPAPAPSAC